MDRFSGANYTLGPVSFPLTLVNGATIRTFRDLNLGTNTAGSFPNALWFTGEQESLLAPVTAIGLTPTDTDNTQLLQAIRTIGANYLTIISATPGSALTVAEAGTIQVNAAGGNITIELPASA